MRHWTDKLKLGKGSVFVKRQLRLLPLTDAECEADFFRDPLRSTERQEHWTGMVIERGCGSLLAMEDVRMPPPTVSDLATLLSCAMCKSPAYEQRQRPRRIYLRDRPQWQELLPHLEQLEIEVVLVSELPWFDQSVEDWIAGRTTRPIKSDLAAILSEPFPERTRNWFTDAMSLMEWTESMCKGAYPSRSIAAASYEPTPVVSVTALLLAVLAATSSRVSHVIGQYLAGSRGNVVNCLHFAAESVGVLVGSATVLCPQ